MNDYDVISKMAQDASRHLSVREQLERDVKSQANIIATNSKSYDNNIGLKREKILALQSTVSFQDAEIAQLKDSNKTNERLIDKFFAGYDGDLQGQHMLDSLDTLFNIIRQKSQGNADLIDAGSALRATIKELRAEANHFNEKSVVAELKYDRLVSLIKRESCDISLILGVHRENEAKLKASKVK